MKLRTVLILLCALALLFCACTENIKDVNADIPPSVSNDDVKVTGRITDAESENEENNSIGRVNVSPLASENFLLPLENYSWEQENKPEYIVLHFTSAVVLSRSDPYDMEKVRGIFEDNEISIHYIIDRNGNIECYIPENRSAWHAGRGEFAGDEKLTNAMNKYSIGIEILAIGSQSDMSQYLTSTEYNALDEEFIGFTDAQYASLKSLASDICERNGIPFDRAHVIGHSEYNSSKSDPGELFDWNMVFGE